jgi:predicted hotdog family 3-hydroxylacyl-ACP dehydratase
MQPGDINILDLLPQRPPFVMIDRLQHYDPKRTVTTFLVSRNSIFFDNERLTEAGLIENMAQTCAARMGYINKEIEGGTVKLGFIGSIKNMSIYRLPLEGETITTEINVLEEVFQMTLVNVSVRSSDSLIADGEMKISITNIDKAND